MIGAWPNEAGTQFRVWAPHASHLDVISDQEIFPLEKSADGYFSGFWSGFTGPRLYKYRIEGRGPFPDPASRFQPQGVHGPSQVIDPRTFSWRDASWKGVALKDAILYELHVGTFTPAGTFEGVRQKLPELAKLGVNVLELMPVAEFPGARNWGYDGTYLFAPEHAYGTPDDFRRLVNEAHALKLAVIQDVVYNHFGPDGNYLSQYSPFYFTDRHPSPWGAGVNLDGDQARHAREFFIENALHWIQDYHLDGLRFDATHTMVDKSPRHFLAELTQRLRAAVPERQVLLFAEDMRAQPYMVKNVDADGWGMDGVWSDDFHHELRRYLAGDQDGYFKDYAGTVPAIATTMQKRTADVPLSHFVFCIQNHDQIGNRAFGERLHHQIDLAVYRAASALLISAPETPLLFMGQEWAASTPFQFFTDHVPELGGKVTAGRREEFKAFSAFADPAVRASIPDPQATTTWENSRLKWEERAQDPHHGMLQLYTRLLNLRRRELAFQGSLELLKVDEHVLSFRRKAAGGPSCVFLFCFRGTGQLNTAMASGSELVFSTEDAEFVADAQPPVIQASTAGLSVAFKRPGALIFRQKL